MFNITAYIVPHPPIIIPDIGRGEELKIDKTIKSFHQIARKIAEIKPETIIVISPHAKAYSDCFYLPLSEQAKGSFRDFGASNVQVSVEIDQVAVRQIVQISNEYNTDVYSYPVKEDLLDHGTMVPLYFINQYYTDYQLIKIPLSGLSNEQHYHLGQSIQAVIKDQNKKVVVIASGDLSHKLKTSGPYGYAKEGPRFDQEITEAMKIGDFIQFLSLDEELCSKAAECGRRSFIIMAGIMDGYSVESTLLSYEGPFGVGYAVAEFTTNNIDESRKLLPIYEKKIIEQALMKKINEDAYVQLARQSLEYYVTHHQALKLPQNLSEALINQKAGVFVSLKIAGELRGCIGTTGPTTLNIASEIIQNAVSAGTKDPRFTPVRANELNKISYSVDVLGKVEPVHSLEDLDPIRYGVIVLYQYKSGLLLPNLEGVDTVEEQLQIVLRKANINPKDAYSLQRFEVIRHY